MVAERRVPRRRGRRRADPAAGRAGVRGFLVARGTPGLIPGRKEHKLGIRASETAQVHFEDCRVHKDMMLGIGASSEGLGDTKKMLDSTRPMVGAQAVGIARAAFDYLVERVQGGTIHGSALKQHQHVAFELAEMEMEIQAARALVHKSAWMADHGQDNVRMASIAKAYGVVGLPTTYFVDARGVVRVKLIGEADGAAFERAALELLK